MLIESISLSIESNRFKVLKTGKFIIPSFKLGSHTIPAIDFKVEASPYDEAYFIKTSIDKKSESLYPGQHFRIKVDIYIDTNYASQGNFITPELSSKGLKFRSFANRSSHNQHIENVAAHHVADGQRISPLHYRTDADKKLRCARSKRHHGQANDKLRDAEDDGENDRTLYE